MAVTMTLFQRLMTSYYFVGSRSWGLADKHSIMNDFAHIEVELSESWSRATLFSQLKGPIVWAPGTEYRFPRRRP